MKNVLFISERSIKENSIIEENVDSKIIRLAIKESQDLELLPIIGQAKYDEIVEELIEKDNDKDYIIQEDIKILLNRFIKDFLNYATLLNITTSLTYKATNKGFLTINDTNATTTIGSDLENVKRYYRGKYDSYRKRLIDYYNQSCGNSNSTIAPYSTGWFLSSRPNYADILEAEANKRKL